MNWIKQDAPDAGSTPGAPKVGIGSSMSIKGELTGDEDLTIDGRVEGKIFLNNHQLTVGKNGRIRADIRDARSVVIHGEIRGNIAATDRVEVAGSGTMHGDIRAPRVVLADGARFKGRIDMEPVSAAAGAEETARGTAKSGGTPAARTRTAPREAPVDP